MTDQTDSWKYNPDYHRVSNFLGVDVHDRQDYGIAQKVSVIRDWASSHGDDSTEGALTHIQKLRKGMGIPYQGKPLVDELYQHVRLEMDRKAKAPLQPKKSKPKAQPIQKMVGSAVQQTVSGMVKNVLKDKKILQGAIQSAIKESFNGK